MDAIDKRSITSPQNGNNGGVKTQKGKEISSKNSTTHGIFTRYSTSLDDMTFEDAYELFAEEFGSTTPSRSALISQLAILFIRLRRCSRFESEFLKSRLKPPIFENKLVKKGFKSAFELDNSMFQSTPDEYETIVVDPGDPMTMDPAVLSNLENLYIKYEAQFLSRFCRIIVILTRNEK